MMTPLLTLLLATLMSPAPPAPELEVITLKATLKAPKIVQLSAAQLRGAEEIVAAQRAYEAHISALSEEARERAFMERIFGEESIKRWPKRHKALALKQGISLDLTLTNTSDKDVVFSHGGDAQLNTITLTGPGAVSFPYSQGMTAEYRFGARHTIKPGASKTFTIKELRYGSREMDRWLVTAAGVYQVSLKLRSNTDNKFVEAEAEPVQFTVVLEQ